jgi:hypothetical protein
MGASIGVAIGLAFVACSREASWPKPVPTLASSPQAAAAFDEIRQAWGAPDRANAAELRQRLEGFLLRFPRDGLVPLAHVYLALLALGGGDLDSADRHLAASDKLPPGSAHDLWTVANARRLRLRGQSAVALELLRPLVGKNVDPVTRAVFEEELTLAALATHREYEAISYMDAWLRATAEERRDDAVHRVSALVGRLPKEVLVNSLQAMRSRRASLGYGADIERILAATLARMATESGDADLARLLLDPNAGAIESMGDGGAELSELATSRRGLDVVEGRTIGLLLPTELPGLRDESADVLRGVMWALGLPEGVRTAALPAEAGAPAGARESCAPLETAPALAEPRPHDRLRLVTRDDAGSTARTEVSLDELAGEGSAVIIAGLDTQTAARALRWADAHRIALVALVPPSQGGAGPFGFVLGESRGAVLEALARAAPSLVSERVVPVIDLSEVPIYPSLGGRLGPITFLPPLSCDTPAMRAGEPRFPVAQWDHDSTRAWLVSGSANCGRDLAGELSLAHVHGVVALTLEAAALPAHAYGLRILSASAGVVPAATAADPRDDEVQRFAAVLGNVSWWTALGRDAATLARIAVGELPTDTVTAPSSVVQRRARARDRLGSARARLWSTEQVGWTAVHTMSRTICTIDAGLAGLAESPRADPQ